MAGCTHAHRTVSVQARAARSRACPKGGGVVFNFPQITVRIEARIVLVRVYARSIPTGLYCHLLTHPMSHFAKIVTQKVTICDVFAQLSAAKKQQVVDFKRHFLSGTHAAL